MRTFPARISRRPRPAGFTVVELVLVLMLLGVILLLGIPAFQNLLQNTLQAEAGRLAGVIRLLRNEAVLTRSTYRLLLDLRQGAYSVQRLDDAGAYRDVTDPRVLAPHALPTQVKVVALTLLGRTYRPDEPEPLPVQVDSSGYLDPFLLWLTHGDEDFTLRVSGFTGKVELLDGHVER